MPYRPRQGALLQSLIKTIFMLYGPILVSFVFLVTGWILQKYPPRKINHWYGYRTPASTRNQERWDFANAYCAKQSLYLSALVLTLSITLSALILWVQPAPETVRSIDFWLTIAAALGITIALLNRTEKALKEKFGA